MISAVDTVMASVVLIAMSGCDKGEDQPGKAMQDEGGKRPEPEAAPPNEGEAAPVPATPNPRQPVASAPTMLAIEAAKVDVDLAERHGRINLAGT